MSRYINADEFAKHIKNGSPVIFDSATINEIIFALDTEPRVDAEPVMHAHWVREPEDTAYENVWTCSRCGEEFIQHRKPKYRFCPNCGARMDEETDDGRD